MLDSAIKVYVTRGEELIAVEPMQYNKNEFDRVQAKHKNCSVWSMTFDTYPIWALWDASPARRHIIRMHEDSVPQVLKMMRLTGAI